jgi:hypothetical protein
MKINFFIFCYTNESWAFPSFSDITILIYVRYKVLGTIYSVVQILRFWTLYIFLSLPKRRPVYFLEHYVSETGFCLRIQVRATHLGPIDRASPYLRRQNPVSETLCFGK